MGNEKIQPDKKRFQFADHPWISLIVFMFVLSLAVLLSYIVYVWIFKLSPDSATVYSISTISYYILTLFVIVPFVLHLPNGKRTISGRHPVNQVSTIHPAFSPGSILLSHYVVLSGRRDIGVSVL